LAFLGADGKTEQLSPFSSLYIPTGHARVGRETLQANKFTKH